MRFLGVRTLKMDEYGGMYWEIVEQSANDYRSNNDLYNGM